MNHDSASKLRDALERRRTKAATPQGLQRIPFQLDMDLADRVEATASQVARLEDWLEDLRDRATERDEAESTFVDVRATGHDLSELGQSITETEAEIERLRPVLAALVEESTASQVELVFRRATADEYEQLLVRAGGAAVDTDVESAFKFHNSLVERCFLRVEIGGEDAQMGTWAEFVKAADLSFGELDPIRAMVWAANKRGGNSIPFSSTPSKQTRRH